MENKLGITLRDVVGTKEVRRLRHNGTIPGVIYGDNKQPVNISLSQKELESVCYSSAFYNSIIDINLGSEVEKIIPRDIDFHPVTDKPLHVDFQRVAKGEKVRVHIAVNFINDDKSIGLKKGGVLNIVVHQLECFCSPDNIPEKITLDLSGKDIGYGFLLADVNLPEGVVPSNPERDSVIATIVGTRATASEESDESSSSSDSSTSSTSSESSSES